VSDVRISSSKLVPSMVCVFPLPVWPYANTVLFTPCTCAPAGIAVILLLHVAVECGYMTAKGKERGRGRGGGSKHNFWNKQSAKQEVITHHCRFSKGVPARATHPSKDTHQHDDN
jgi:hypothetical protein